MFSIKANPAHFTFFDSFLVIALKSKIGSDFTSCCWIYPIFFLQGFWYLEPLFFFHREKGSINTNYVSRPLLIYTPTQENLFGQQHSSKMDPFYTHVVNVTCQKLQKCWLLSEAYLLCICKMYLKPSAGSGSPRPESPTGFSRFWEAREGPSPKFFKAYSPKPARARTLSPRVARRGFFCPKGAKMYQKYI